MSIWMNEGKSEVSSLFSHFHATRPSSQSKAPSVKNTNRIKAPERLCLRSGKRHKFSIYNEFL